MLRDKMIHRIERLITKTNGGKSGDLRSMIYPLAKDLTDEYLYGDERNKRIAQVATDVVLDAIKRYDMNYDGDLLAYVCWFLEASVTLVLERTITRHPDQIKTIEDFYIQLGLLLAGVTYTYEIADMLGVEDNGACFTKIFKVLMRQRIA